MQNNQVTQISNPGKTVIALPVQKYKVLNKNRTKNVVTNATNEYKEIFTALLKIQDETYSISEIEKVNKFLFKSNSSIEELKTKFVNMNKAKEIEKLLINKYPQIDGYITEIQIKYRKDKKNNIHPAHSITIEFNGKSNQLSFSYLTGKDGQKKYKNADIKEFVKFKNCFYNTTVLNRLENEIPSLKGHIKVEKVNKNEKTWDFYVYIYKDISNESEEPFKRNFSTLLRNKEKYKNLSFDEIYSLLENNFKKYKPKKSEEDVFNEFVLDLIPDFEKERIISFKIRGEKNLREIEVELRDKKYPLTAKLERLRKRKKENEKYNSIEDLFKLKKDNKLMSEESIKEKLGDKAKYFHKFEKVRDEDNKNHYYFIFFNIEGHITPKWKWATITNYLSLSDEEFKERIKNGVKPKTKTDKEVEYDLKLNPKYIETINKYNNKNSNKLRIETTKLIERTKTTSTQKFSIRDSFDNELEFYRSGLDFKTYTIRFSSSQNFSCAGNRNVSKGEYIVEETITSLSKNIPFGVRSQDNSLLENHIFDYVFNVAGNPYAILEVDGTQHYNEEAETFTRTPLEEQRNKDKEKNVFASQNNLRMARIRYDKLEREIEKLLFEANIYITFLNFSNIQYEELNKKNQERFQEEVNFHLKHSLQDILTELELEDTDENIKQLYGDLEWMLEYHNESENIPENILNELPILNQIKEKFNIRYF